MEINNLGKDILSIVSLKLDDESVLNFSIICKEIHHTFCKHIFKYYLINKYPVSVLNHKKEDESWKFYFVKTNYYRYIYMKLFGFDYYTSENKNIKKEENIKYVIDDLLIVNGKNSLLYQTSDLKAIKFLVNRGADIHYRNDDLFIRLLKYEVNDLSVIKYLVEKGVDINRNNKPLFVAVKYNNFKAVKYLVKNGVKMNNPRALATAIVNKKWNIVKYLVKHGINISKTITYLENHTFSLDKNMTIIYLKNILSNIKEGKKVNYECDYIL